MASLDRRRFLSLASATAVAASLPAYAEAAAGNLRVVFFTDTHTQPELGASEGTALALAKIKGLRPDLCIQGGDHVMDLNSVPRDRSVMLLDLYQKTEQALNGIPIQHVIGNHDVFGRDPASGVAESDPLYGKKAFEQRFNTKTYRSFDRAGYHFILLDSIQITAARDFDAVIDVAQLEWLKQDLGATAKGTPIVIVCHVPLVSAAPQYTPPDDKAAAANAYQALTGLHHFLLGNSFDVLRLLDGNNVIAVLQGHTHINEVVRWQGVPFITSGAVCGNWWQGTRWGTPEGFTVLELAGGKVQWRYETYGWHAVNPAKDPYGVRVPGK